MRFCVCTGETGPTTFRVLDGKGDAIGAVLPLSAWHTVGLLLNKIWCWFHNNSGDALVWGRTCTWRSRFERFSRPCVQNVRFPRLCSWWMGGQGADCKLLKFLLKFELTEITLTFEYFFAGHHRPVYFAAGGRWHIQDEAQEKWRRQCHFWWEDNLQKATVQHHSQVQSVWQKYGKWFIVWWIQRGPPPADYQNGRWNHLVILAP